MEIIDGIKIFCGDDKKYENEKLIQNEVFIVYEIPSDSYAVNHEPKPSQTSASESKITPVI